MLLLPKVMVGMRFYLINLFYNSMTCMAGNFGRMLFAPWVLLDEDDACEVFEGTEADGCFPLVFAVTSSRHFWRKFSSSASVGFMVVADIEDELSP